MTNDIREVKEFLRSASPARDYMLRGGVGFTPVGVHPDDLRALLSSHDALEREVERMRDALELLATHSAAAGRIASTALNPDRELQALGGHDE